MIKLTEEVTLKNRILMAPMAGITDRAFRELVVKSGAALTYAEMVSAKALHFKNEKTGKMLKLAPDEEHIGVQLFGDEPEIMAEIAASFNDDPDVLLVDVNMGCPAPKIVKNGEGSALMLDPEKAERIIRAISRKCTKPVTCKFRRGYRMGEEMAPEFAKRMESAGARLITVHGRFRDQFYSGESDREVIKKVKRAVSIPVIGNGDIFTGEDAVRMLDETGCDGIMIARGALGNPWIFEEVTAALEGKPYERPDNAERIRTAIGHLSHAVEYEGEHIAVPEMRKHLAYYLKGMPGASSIKNEINTCNEYLKVREILTRYMNEQIQNK